MIEENDKKKNKKIEIVKGNSKDLEISDVKDNLNFEKPNDSKKGKIIIPENVNSDDEK